MYLINDIYFERLRKSHINCCDHTQELYVNRKNPPKTRFKNSWNRRLILVPATVWQIWIWSKGNRKRKLCEFEETFMEKFVKSPWPNLYFGWFLTFGTTVLRTACSVAAGLQTYCAALCLHALSYWLDNIFDNKPCLAVFLSLFFIRTNFSSNCKNHCWFAPRTLWFDNIFVFVQGKLNFDTMLRAKGLFSSV